MPFITLCYHNLIEIDYIKVWMSHTLNSLFSREFIFTICFDCESTIYFANLLSFSRIHYLFRDSTINSLFVQRIHYLFREYCLISLYILQIHYEFTIHFGNILWFHYKFRDFFYFTISLANWLWIHNLFCKFTMNSDSVSWVHYLFRENSSHSSSISQIQREST